MDVEKKAKKYAGFPLDREIGYEEEHYAPGKVDVYYAFIAGYEEATCWIPVEEKLPPCSNQDLLIKGIDTRGIEGIVDIGYMHDNYEMVPKVDGFISLGGVLVKVTHWRYID